MRLQPLVWALALVFLSACSSNTPAASPRAEEDPTAAVLAVEQKLCEAYLKGDTQRIAELLTDDFQITNGRGEINSKAMEIAEIRSGAVRYQRFRNRDSKVRFYGERTAVVMGVTEVAGSSGGGQTFDVAVRFTDVYVKQGSQWRLASGHVSPPLPGL